MSSRAIFRASVQGAKKPGTKLSGAPREIQRVLLDEMGYRLAPQVTRIFRDFAPHDKGRLERGLQSTVTSAGGRITVNVVSTAESDDGYPYTDVTRFGHRKAWIYPTGGRKFLRFKGSGGGFVFARRVRGQVRRVDWARLAGDATDQAIAEREDEIGRQIVSRVI